MAGYFFSDNSASVSPELLEAIHEANAGQVKAYGDDPWTQRLNDAFGKFFEAEVFVFPLSTGTAANSLALATLVPPYGAIFAHGEAHIVRDECGAPEFYTGGGRIVEVEGADGKMNPDAFAETLDAWPTSVHTYQPSAVALTQATELGTVYGPHEISAISSSGKPRLVHSKKPSATLLGRQRPSADRIPPGIRSRCREVSQHLKQRNLQIECAA